MKQQVSGPLFEEFSYFLAENMGLHYPKERWNDLLKKLQPIAESFGFQQIDRCIEWLMHHPLNREQLTVLAYHLTIGETYFFRDSKSFFLFEHQILPEIIQRHEKDRRIRIWSAGCCSGEEPYSLAILLHRMIPNIKEWDIHIFGSDINPEFIKKAEAGKYTTWSFRATPAHIKERYFTRQTDGSYVLKAHIRNMVKFHYLNLVEDRYLWQGVDLIICHNVLIYFSKKHINKTICQFADTLSEKGWLSVTPIEAPFIHDERLCSVHFSGMTLFKKEKQKKQHETKPIQVKQKPHPPKALQPKPEDLLLKVVLPAFLQPTQPVLEFHFTAQNEKPMVSAAANCVQANGVQANGVQANCVPANGVQENRYDLCTKLYQQKQYALVAEKLQAHHDLDYKELQLLIRTLANQGQFAQALVWCDKALEIEKLDPLLHYLRATIQMSCSKDIEAIESAKRALFLNPNFISAHYLLGLLERQRGSKEQARRCFKTVLELLEKQSPDDILEGSEDLTAAHLQEHIFTLMEAVK